MNLSTLIRISRPRFWHYVLGPMLIYFASSWYFENIQSSFSRGGTDRIFHTIIFIIILWYFTLPANLWIYGWNDLADGDTDKFNSKKWDYENKIEDIKDIKSKLKRHIINRNIWYILIWWFIAFILAIITDCFPWEINNSMCTRDWISFIRWISIIYIRQMLWIVVWLLIPFFITSYLYSCKPLRAKAKPFIDGIMNILYIATPFTIIFISHFDYWDYSLSTISIIIYNFLAALFRCMAMHCYSAIPDIEPDHKAWLTTTAVYLGKNKSLIYCWILYLLSAILSFPTLWWFSILWGIVYLSMIIISYYKKDIFVLYKLFPYINLIIGFSLFRYIILYIS